MDDESLAGQALKEGAEDYLIKGQIETRGLLRALRYAIERKRMEEAVFVEKELAEVTLNSIGDAVISSDVSGNITYLNLAAEEMTGLASAGSPGSTHGRGLSRSRCGQSRKPLPIRCWQPSRRSERCTFYRTAS